jgi:hypothetical protein
MALYDLKMFCTECGEFHVLGVRVTVDASFETRSVSEVYQGMDLPPEVYSVRKRRIHCPVTDRWVTQYNTDRILLVATQLTQERDWPPS